jgi:hypothetical protein
LIFGFFSFFLVQRRQAMLKTKLLLSEPDRLRFIREGDPEDDEIQRSIRALFDVHGPRAKKFEVLIYDWGYIADIEYREPRLPKGGVL